MKRELSAKLTILPKIILPIFVLFIWSIVTLTAFFSANPRTAQPKFLFLGLLFVLAAFFYFTVMRFMKVSVDEDFLYVSNYLKEIAVPLSDIVDVTEITWIRGHPVTIHLKTATPFGKKITFMPKPRFFKFFSPHPVVDELRQLAKNQLPPNI